MHVASMRRAKQSNWHAMAVGAARCEAQWLSRRRLRWGRVKCVGGGTDRGVLERAGGSDESMPRAQVKLM
jgi:hypothetical protein